MSYLHGYVLADINIVVDMTLTQHPSESPYIQALSAMLSTSLSQDEKANLQSRIDEYINEIVSLYYNIPDTSSFLYTVSSPLTTRYSGNSISYELFHRVEVGEGDYLFTPVDLDEVLENEDSIAANAAEEVAALQVNAENIMSPRTSVTYYRLEARDYAIAHATDVPEFNSSSDGSDCANFVSKALNAGGFPIDNSNQWYPASIYGNMNYCGVNWMRTGFYDNGGIIPYMVDIKGYFEQATESATNAGCIMYWTEKSHVALVTYGDTEVIKYTQHSSRTLTAAESTNVVYDSDEISAYFYKPTSLVTVYDPLT